MCAGGGQHVGGGLAQVGQAHPAQQAVQFIWQGGAVGLMSEDLFFFVVCMLPRLPGDSVAAAWRVRLARDRSAPASWLWARATKRPARSSASAVYATSWPAESRVVPGIGRRRSSRRCRAAPSAPRRRG